MHDWQNLYMGRLILLLTKHINCVPYGFRGDFLIFSPNYKSKWKTIDPQGNEGMASFNTRGTARKFM